MRVTTKHCAKYGQRDISVAYDEHLVLESDVTWLLGWLESEAANGRRFLAGETIQIGWMVTKLETFEDGMLEICEPDMKAFPVKFVNSVTNTLIHLRFQKMVVESIGCEQEFCFPSLRQTAITCNSVGKHAGIFMDRMSPRDNDSGWFIGCVDPNHNHQEPTNLARKSLYEIVVRYEPIITSYLAIPPGISVYIRDGIPVFHRGESKLAILSDSFLAASLSKK
jgi:hypothetical protein